MTRDVHLILIYLLIGMENVFKGWGLYQCFKNYNSLYNCNKYKLYVLPLKVHMF